MDVGHGGSRLAASRGSGDFAVAFTRDGLHVERNAGVHEALGRAVMEPPLPAYLPDRSANVETPATRTITLTEVSAELHVSGPLLRNVGAWEIEPIDGDCIRVSMPRTLYPGGIDVVRKRTLGAR